MPQLNEIIANREKKKFVKKNYRAWDLAGSGDTPGEFYEKGKIANQQTSQLSSNTVSNHNTPIETPKIPKNKGSKQESATVQSSSVLQFSEVHNGSNNGSHGFNKDSTKVRMNSNFETHLEFNNPAYIIKKLIRKLGGNERKLFFFILNICSQNGSLSTGEIFGEDIDTTLEMPRNSRETAIKRMQKKGLLIRGVGKRGANGVLFLSLPEIVKIEALSYLSTNQSERNMFFSGIGLNRVQNPNQDKVQLEYKSPLYSSSNFNNTTTDLNEEWKKLNIEPLRDFGFSETHIKQLCLLNTPEVVQASINHFSYALENNPKVKQYPDPLNVFMGVLRKGQAWFEKNYVSPQEKAQQLINEQKKMELERLKKLEDEAYEIALNEWMSSISDTEIEVLVPPKISGSSIPHKTRVRLYFKENIWPNKKSEYLAIKEI